LFVELFQRQNKHDYQKILDYVHREKKPLVDHNVQLIIGGIERELDLTVAPVIDPGGQILALIHILRPSRYQSEVASDLGHIEKLTNIGQIAAGMAHELNTPLGSIILSTDLVREQSTNAESVIEEVSKIRAQADHCSKVVKQLLSYVRKDEGFKAVQDLNVVVGKVVELVGAEARKRQIAIEIQATLENAEILGNENQIEQLFFNLLSNAFQAIDHNGSIVIQIGRDALLKQVTVSVTDNGSGILEDHLDKIFDPFFTTKAGKEGTGLGLALCRKIMIEHGGRVTVESRVDQGTTFELYFPTVE
jgi:signal transduction histidine kinase